MHVLLHIDYDVNHKFSRWMSSGYKEHPLAPSLNYMVVTNLKISIFLFFLFSFRWEDIRLERQIQEWLEATFFLPLMFIQVLIQFG